jgi:L-alanine-DL-glutamate epimerase-like enolase superfamily enzyme
VATTIARRPSAITSSAVIAGCAVSALDIGLWDLAGKAANLPLAKLWGATTDTAVAAGAPTPSTT